MPVLIYQLSKYVIGITIMYLSYRRFNRYAQKEEQDAACQPRIGNNLKD